MGLSFFVALIVQKIEPKEVKDLWHLYINLCRNENRLCRYIPTSGINLFSIYKRKLQYAIQACKCKFLGAAFIQGRRLFFFFFLKVASLFQLAKGIPDQLRDLPAPLPLY